MEEKFMDCYNNSNCSPDKCGGCPGCGGEAIEKITIKVEWKHKGQTPEDADGINEIMTELSGELMVSGVELVYINNSFGEDIPNNTSAFFINSHALSGLVEIPTSGPISQEQLRKGIFQALLKNL